MYRIAYQLRLDPTKYGYLQVTGREIVGFGSESILKFFGSQEEAEQFWHEKTPDKVKSDFSDAFILGPNGDRIPFGDRAAT